MDKGSAFRALHHGSGAFVIPNPWDVGTARFLASLGFEALATTSAGFAFSRGLPDGAVGFETMIQHCREIVAATDLPVSADLEKGKGDSPESAAETVFAAEAAGLAGCSIEDAAKGTLYEFEHAVERVAAASRVKELVLTARCENFLRGKPDLDDTIKRLLAYEQAGADVLMAPGLPDLDSVRKVCAALSRPFNFMAGIKGKSFSVAELKAAGVKRISLATSLWRAAMSGLMEAAREVKDKGTFTYLDRSVPTPEIVKLFER